MGIVSSVLGGVTGISTAKLATYAGIGIVILGGVVYFLVRINAEENKISTLTKNNLILTASVASLKDSNQAQALQITADAANITMLQQEETTLRNTDAAANAALDAYAKHFSNITVLANQVSNRNSPATQQKFLDSVNSNIDCMFSNMSNGKNGICKDGQFTESDTTTTKAVTP